MPDTYISPPSSAFHEALAAIVGEKGLVTDPQARQFHTTNWQGMAPAAPPPWSSRRARRKSPRS
jgi:hypothetical protein